MIDVIGQNLENDDACCRCTDEFVPKTCFRGVGLPSPGALPHFTMPSVYEPLLQYAEDDDDDAEEEEEEVWGGGGHSFSYHRPRRRMMTPEEMGKSRQSAASLARKAPAATFH